MIASLKDLVMIEAISAWLDLSTVPVHIYLIEDLHECDWGGHTFGMGISQTQLASWLGMSFHPLTFPMRQGPLAGP